MGDGIPEMEQRRVGEEKRKGRGKIHGRWVLTSVPMPLRVATFLLAVVLITPIAWGQQRIDNGPFKGFIREEPTLNLMEIPEPFRVREIKGVLYYGEDSPVAEAFFEIRDASGKIITTRTDKNGGFSIPSIKPGTYQFKATMNQFHSTVGTIIVSARAPRKNKISLQMQIGT